MTEYNVTCTLEKTWKQLGKYSFWKPAEVTDLLRVMVLRGSPPANFMSQLRPIHVQVVEEGARLRVALPAYFARRWALVDTHCPLIQPILAIVKDYADLWATEELWATGLGSKD
jgi:hypothetical protein